MVRGRMGTTDKVETVSYWNFGKQTRLGSTQPKVKRNWDMRILKLVKGSFTVVRVVRGVDGPKPFKSRLTYNGNLERKLLCVRHNQW